MPNQGCCVIEEIETRVLYSADTPWAIPSAAGEHPVSEPAIVATYQEYSAIASNVPMLAGHVSSVQSREVAFVDAGLADVNALTADLQALAGPGRSIEVILLDRDADGLLRIGEVLAQRVHLDAIHVVTHGTNGAVNLGSTQLDFELLLARARDIKAWSGALAPQADIFLYGCDVAGTPDGEALVEALARLTGADVAASTDVTGNASARGDWVLEFQVGVTESGRTLGVAGSVSWQGSLAHEHIVNVASVQDQNTESTDGGSQKAVAMDAAGNYVVVWTSRNQDGSQDGVYARRFDSSGAALTGEILVNQTTSKDQRWASVASDDAGNFVVTWTDDDDAGDRGQIYLRRFAANGGALTAETLVNTTVTTSVQENSSIAMDSTSGDFVVVWQGVGAGDGDGIFFRRYNADGTAKDAVERNANLSDSGEEENPAVAMSASGDFVVAWERSNRVYFQRFDSGGTAQGAATVVDSGLGYAAGPAIAMGPTGDFTIVYSKSLLLTGVWGRGFNADGTEKYTWFQADSGDAAEASIAMAADGSFIVSYDKTSDGDGRGVYARKYLPGGSPDGSAFRVNETTTGIQQYSSVALIDIDTSVVVWSGNGPGDTGGVFARAFQADNVAPVNTVPGAQSTREDVKITFSSANGNLIAIDDADAGAANLQVTLTAVNGVLSLSGIAGLSFTAGDGTADGTMTFTGSKVDINNALAGLDFRPTANFSGSASLTILTDDLGNSGFGGALTDTDAIAITVSAVNDAPTAAADAYTVLENQTLTVNAAGGVLANDSDPEGHTLAVLSATGVANGSLSLLPDGSFTYTPNAAFNGTDTFSYLVRDTSDGRTHYWGLEGSAADAIGASSGTISGATTVAGQFGSALSFNGSSDYVSVSDFGYSNAFTVSFWFKAPTNAGSDYGYLYSHGDVGVQSSLNVYFIEDSTPVAGAGKLRTQIRDANDADNQNGLDVDIATLGLADNAWHLYTLSTATGTGATLYIDGVQRASIANGGDSFDPAGNLVLGGRNDLNATRFFQGGLDGVQVHDHALEASEVSDIFLATPGTVTLTVTANTAPAITSNGGGATASVNVAENGTAVTTVTATDGEAPPQTLTYSLSGADAGLFSLGASTGVLTFSAAPDRETPLDADADSVYEVTVTVSDGTASDSQDLSITVTDVNDSAVSAISDLNAGADAVAENAANTTSVGITAHAMDADASVNSITYSLDNDAGGRFAIDSVTGVVTVAGSSLLDYDTTISHTIVVRATSADTSFSTASIVIALTPLNDNSPVFSSSAAPSVVEGNATAVTLTVTDADAPAQTLTYSITGGTDQGRFTLVGNALQFTTVPDYEIPGDADGNNVYLVEVTANDGAGGSTSQSLSVTVTDASETPSTTTEAPPVLLVLPVDASDGDDSVPVSSTVLPDPVPSASTLAEVAASISAKADTMATPSPVEAATEGDGSPAIPSSTQDRGFSGRRNLTNVVAYGTNGAWARPQFLPVAASEAFQLGNGMNAPPGAAVSVEALRSSLAASPWVNQLQMMRDRLDEEMRLDGVMIGATAFVSGGLSVGYVLWLVRGGLLMSTLLSSLPAWHTVDPLPVLGNRTDDDDGVRDDAVESLFERAKKVWRAGNGAGVVSTARGPA